MSYPTPEQWRSFAASAQALSDKKLDWAGNDAPTSSEIDWGGQAFPTEGGDNSGLYPDPGMSLRDYFAVHADQPGYAEIVSHAGLTYGNNQVWKDATTSIGSFDVWWRGLPNSERFRLSAEVRYAMADAMIAARKGGA